MHPVSHTTIVDGVRIHERRAGSGPTIVFVHGLAVSSRYFVRVMQVLSARYECRAPDLPGFGRSDDPPVQLGVEGLGDALAGWLRTNGIETAVLVGNSAGCQYIVDCVARHSDITGPVVLIGPTTDPAARTARAQVARWLRTGATADVVQLPMIIRDCRDAGLRRVGRTFSAMLDDRVEDKLPTVSQPALVVRGAKDPLVPRRWADEVTTLLPHGRLVEVDGGAHVVHVTRPQETGAAIDAFLGRVGTR